jgi:hypothetical protein
MRVSMRGLGVAVAPGSPCYDDSHDPGETHCVTFPLNLFESDATYDCSAAEIYCVNNGAPAVTLTPDLSSALSPGLPVGYDSATGTVADSNTTGATVPPSQTAIQSAITSQLPTDDTTPDCTVESPSCTWLGINCLNQSCAPGLTTIVLVGAVALLGAAILAGMIVETGGKRR